MSVRVAFILICAAASVFAQTEAPAASGATAKVSLPPSAQTDSSPAATVEPPAPAPETNPAAPKTTAEPPAQAFSLPVAPDKPSATKTSAEKNNDPRPQAETPGRKPYIFGENDIIIVKIWNQPSLSGTFPVGSDGYVSIPIVGDIKAAGLNARQVTAELTERLKQCCVNNPEGEVDVQLGKNNSKRYTVYGGVGRPGEYPLDRDDFTILDAMASVGGFGPFANKKKIYVLRGTQRFDFNYEDAIKGKHPEKNILIQNGDRIVVPE